MPDDGSSAWFGRDHDDEQRAFANRPSRGKRSKVKAARKAARRNRR